MSHKGNSLTIPEKEIVVHVKHYFDKEQELYSKTKEFPSVINPARRTALATNLSEVTVWRIMAEYNRNNTQGFKGEVSKVLILQLYVPGKLRAKNFKSLNILK